MTAPHLIAAPLALKRHAKGVAEVKYKELGNEVGRRSVSTAEIIKWRFLTPCSSPQLARPLGRSSEDAVGAARGQSGSLGFKAGGHTVREGSGGDPWNDANLNHAQPKRERN